ncbi:hypothetical protein [Parvibaculum sp.]|uniref:hypothetical protein n=1 Tax=Parvibaculum sp. TaxID=2024848 RepID=UPI0027370B04|nr:hypothetical protein [Parvibaculum sp.]MDP3327178.1 hypothetical protein [Parvibaculum sp.]
MADDAEQMEYRIGKLAMAPGDVLVVRMNSYPTRGDAEAIRGYFVRAIPRGCKVLVIPVGIDLSVLTRDEIESRTSEGTAP